MKIQAYIVKYHPKGEDEENPAIKHRYDNLFVQLSAADAAKVQAAGFRVRAREERFYATINLSERCPVDREQLSSDFYGEFVIAKNRIGVMFLKSASLRAIDGDDSEAECEGEAEC